MDNDNQNRTYVYAEAANGLTVRVPLDRYDEWKETQDRIRRGEKVEPDPEMVKRLTDFMKGEDTPNSAESAPHQHPAPAPASTNDTTRKAQKIMSFITSKRIAAVFSILLCITLYFGLLETVFTKKIETFIVYTQEGSDILHGNRLCESDREIDFDIYEYSMDFNKPIIKTTIFENPDKSVCKCHAIAEETTLEHKNYIAPLVISLTISGIVFCILIYKKKA